MDILSVPTSDMAQLLGMILGRGRSSRCRPPLVFEGFSPTDGVVEKLSFEG